MYFLIKNLHISKDIVISLPKLSSKLAISELIGNNIINASESIMYALTSQNTVIIYISIYTTIQNNIIKWYDYR